MAFDGDSHSMARRALELESTAPLGEHDPAECEMCKLGPLPEIVEQSQGGESFDIDSDLIASMRRLQFDTVERDRLGSNGYSAFRKRWTESVVIPRYLEIVERFRR